MKLFVAIVLSCVMISAAIDQCFMKREGTTEVEGTTEIEGTTEVERPICTRMQPCGWDVYDGITEKWRYYIDNMCKCNDGFACVKTRDWDQREIAFKYKCTPVETTTAQETTTLESTTVEPTTVE